MIAMNKRQKKKHPLFCRTYIMLTKRLSKALRKDWHGNVKSRIKVYKLLRVQVKKAERKACHERF